MFTSEVSLMMRKGNNPGRKSRGGASSQMHFGRILCNNISEAASFVYDTQQDLTVTSSIGDAYISPTNEKDPKLYVSQDQSQI